MPVPSSINDLSTTIGSNSPAGSETPGEGDNYIRALSAFIADLRDRVSGTSSAVLSDAEFFGTHTFTDGNLFSTTYTGNGTAVTNCTISSVQSAQYMRIGIVVNVAGTVTLTPTATGACSFRVTLPVASNFTASSNLAGSGATNNTTPSAVYVSADTTNDQALFAFNATSTSSTIVSYNYTYRVI